MEHRDNWESILTQAETLFLANKITQFRPAHALSIMMCAARVYHESDDQLLGDLLNQSRRYFHQLLETQQVDRSRYRDWELIYRQLTKVLSARYQIHEYGHYRENYCRTGFSLGLLLGVGVGLYYLKQPLILIILIVIGVFGGAILGRQVDHQKRDDGLTY